MADDRTYDERGDVIGGYLTPDEARERGVEWHGRPNEPAPYLTPDDARGLGVPWRPASEFPAYNYNNAYAAAATQAPRARSVSALEQLASHVARMSQTPGGWKSGAFALSPAQKRTYWPELPSYWAEKPDYSNIPMTTPDELRSGAGSQSDGSRSMPLPGNPASLPLPDTYRQRQAQYEEIQRQGPPFPGWVIHWNSWGGGYFWGPPGLRT